MINRNLKSILRSTRAGRLLYDWLLVAYKNHLWAQRCRKLRRFGPAIIREAHEILVAADLPYFADYGTLLGAVREHGFIKHDDDVDYTVPCGAPSPKHYLDAFANHPTFKFQWAFEYKGEITELTFSYNEVLVDFFFSRMEDGLAYNYAYRDTPGLVDWKPYRERRCVNGRYEDVDFVGAKLRIPENYDEILTTKYGDWHTPVSYQREGRKDDVAKAIPPEYRDGWAHQVNEARVREIG